MPLKHIEKAIADPKSQDYLKQFAIGIIIVVIALMAIEAIGHYAPNIYGDAKTTIREYGTPGVFVGVFLGSTLLPFPTDLFYTTAVNLAEGWTNKLIIVIVAIIAAFLGSLINYGLAFFLRDKFVLRFASKEQLAQAKELFDKYGAWGIVIFGIIPISAVFDPITFAAGLTGMDLKQFAKYSLLARILHFAGIALLASYITL